LTKIAAMKSFFYISVIALLSCDNPSNQMVDYKDIHTNAIVIDTHNDILTMTMEKGHVMDNDLLGKTHSDLDRFKKGGVDVQFFSIWSDGGNVNPYDFAIRQIDSLDAVVNRNPDKLVEVKNTSEMAEVLKKGKIAGFFGLEGGHMIENDLNKLENLYNRGVRYMTLTWNNSNSWATSASDETSGAVLEHKGLTNFGRKVIHKMNELGMIVDISHVGEQTFWDVIGTTSKPIIASHSSVYTLCPHPRNLKDVQLEAIAKNGGVVSVNFYSGYLDSTYTGKKNLFLVKHKIEYDSLLRSGTVDYLAEERLFEKYSSEVESIRAPFDLVIAHVEYIIDLIGVNHVGLGSDFDGIESTPQLLDDVSTYPQITKSLLEKGYSVIDINKILGGNILRVLKSNEPI
jgi:membrane dipeptidase